MPQRDPPGHEIATATIKRGEAVGKYGQVIGFASSAISPGEHVHTRNLGAGILPVNIPLDPRAGRRITWMREPWYLGAVR